MNEFSSSGFVFVTMGGPLGREGNWAEEHGAERGGESVQGRRQGKPRAVDEGRKRARIGENLIKLHILNETDSCATVASQLRHSCVTVASYVLKHFRVFRLLEYFDFLKFNLPHHENGNMLQKL